MSWKDMLRKGDAWDMEQDYGMSGADIVDMFADENIAATEVVEKKAIEIIEANIKNWANLNSRDIEIELEKKLRLADLERYDSGGFPVGDASFAIDDWFAIDYDEFYELYIKGKHKEE